MSIQFVLALFQLSADRGSVHCKGLWKVLRLRSHHWVAAILQVGAKRHRHLGLFWVCVLPSIFIIKFDIILNCLLEGKRLQKSWSVYIYSFSATAIRLSRLKYQDCLYLAQSKHAFLKFTTELCLIIQSQIVKSEPKSTLCGLFENLSWKFRNV